MTVVWVCAVGLVALGVLADSGPGGWVPVMDRGPSVARAVTRARALRTGSTRGREQRREVITLCRVFAAELRAGRPPEDALRAGLAAAGPGMFGAIGGEPGAEALREAAEADPDLRALAYLAVCWEVAADTGAGLAEVVDALAAELTEQEELRAEIAARTSGPRTTAVILGVLPLVGLLMSAGLGGAPLTFLFTTPLGVLCLVSGVLLNLLGLWWTLRLVRAAVG
ncbi:type II secretion system F family protein [Nocardiopsis sp. N85]|uniref:type II secretion system F family protein n=1 Tax=Nocardiopsis sp. N85 TaxID=3029400 RepID=UPI00237F5282|nr:type II secretion system F family protein [Nocardiopsis sp. N85]MDE3724540.1 type II secretion system F family protein [Nocardiopsis sp. N85]